MTYPEYGAGARCARCASERGSESTSVKITQSRQGNLLVLQPHGPLIGTDADEFAQHFRRAAETHGSNIAINAALVAFVDSRGLEVLVDATNQLLRNGKVLKLMGLSETLCEVLELNELSAMFDLHSEAAAVASK